MGATGEGRGRGRASWVVRADDVSLAVVFAGMRNSLAVVKAAASLLEVHWDRLDAEQRVEMLRDVMRHADLVTGTIADLEHGLPEEARRVVDLREVLDGDAGPPVTDVM